MSSNKYIKAAKSAGESFTIGAGVTTFVLGAVAMVVAVPAAIAIGVAAVVGLIFACISGRNAYKQAEKEEVRKKLQRENQVHLVEMTTDLKRNVSDIKQTLNHSPDIKKHVTVEATPVKKHHHAVPYVRLGDDSNGEVKIELSQVKSSGRCSNDGLFKEKKVYNSEPTERKEVARNMICLTK